MSRRFSPLALLFLCLALASSTGRLAADLVWEPGRGWRAEGGLLGSLMPTEESNRALDLMNRAREAEEAGHNRTALRHYQKVTKRYGASIYAAEALFRSGLIRQKRHQYYKAFEAYQGVLTLYPNSDKFDQTIAEQYRIANGLLEGKRSYIWGLFPGFQNRERAVTYLEQLVVNAPHSAYAPMALMNAARGYQRLREPEFAIDALDRMINNYPKSVLTPDAYLNIGKTHASLVEGPYYDQASTKEAITYFEDFLILFPGDPNAAEAEKGLAEMKTVLARSKMILGDYSYKYRRNYQAAKIYYNEAITTFPDSPVAAEAKEKLAKVEEKLAALPPPVVPDPNAAPAVQPPQPKKKKKKFWLF